MLVGEDCTSLRSQSHFTGRPRRARGPQHEAMLGILPALDAEGAADIAGDDADLAAPAP